MYCHAEYLLAQKLDIPLDSKEVQHVESELVSTINTRLNESVTRSQGLLMLTDLLSKPVSKELLQEYGPLWISKATLSLSTTKSDDQEITNACKAIGSLVIHCKDIPELQKQVSIQNVKQWINLIVERNENERSGALYYLMAVLLYYYPEPCERLQVQIRKILLPHLDSTLRSAVTSSANCFALLLRATERSFKPLPSNPNCNGWAYNQVLLCNNIHQLMDVLFEDFVELDSTENTEKLELEEIEHEENILDYYDKLKRRFVNLGIWLQTLLRGTDGTSSIMHKTVLRLLCRGLAIKPLNKQKDDSLKKQILFLILPELHMTLLGILSSLIESCHEALVGSAKVILELLQQLLEWTDKFSENHTISGIKPLSNVRISIYKTLSTWLTCLGSMSGFEMFAEEFLPHFIKDIVPEKNRVLLTVSKNLTNLKRTSKKKRRSGHYLENSEQHLGIEEAVTKTDICTNSTLCAEALIALRTTFSAAGCFVNANFSKRVQNTIVPLLMEIYLQRSSASDTIYHRSDECRLNLLKVLSAMQMHVHPIIPPPTQYAVEIFGMATREVNPEIAREVKLALAQLQKIVHPSAPSLHRYKQDVEVDETKTAKAATKNTEKAEMIWEELAGRTEIVVPKTKRDSETCVDSPPTKQRRKSSESVSKPVDGTERIECSTIVEETPNHCTLSKEQRSSSEVYELSKSVESSESNVEEAPIFCSSASKEQRIRSAMKKLPNSEVESAESLNLCSLSKEQQTSPEKKRKLQNGTELIESSDVIEEVPQNLNCSSKEQRTNSRSKFMSKINLIEDSKFDDNNEKVQPQEIEKNEINNDKMEVPNESSEEIKEDSEQIIAQTLVENETKDVEIVTNVENKTVHEAMEEDDIEGALGLFCDIPKD